MENNIQTFIQTSIQTSPETIYYYFNKLFFGKLFSMYQAIGLFNLVVGLCGIYLATKLRRPGIFRIKLGIVFSLLVISGVGSMILSKDDFGLLHHSFISSFLILITILYWREVQHYMTTEGYHRKSLGNYIEDVPDLIWVKDLDFRYTYVNKSVLSTLELKLQDIIGKTDQEIRQQMMNNGIRYEIGADHTDHEHKLDQPIIYLDTGYIRDRFIALQVFKGPLYNSDSILTRKHVGYFSIGRDLTFDVEDHNNIATLLSEGDLTKAIDLFDLHRNRYNKFKIESYRFDT
jgi:PAS domain-containing protein